MDNAEEVAKAVGTLLDALVRNYGAVGTLAIAAVLLCAAAAWRIYNDRKKTRETNQTIEFQERALQRAAAEAREWRFFFFKTMGEMSQEDVEKFVMAGEFTDSVDARKKLEQRFGTGKAVSKKGARK